MASKKTKPRKSKKHKKGSSRTPFARRTQPDFLLKLSESQLLLVTFAIAGIYFAYSFFSEGFYQHDEAGHFLSMRRFWHDPNSILGNWQKPGYKLLFALPALLGPTFVAFCNCLVTAFCCYLAYKLAQTVGSKTPVFAFLLLAFQPLWLQLSFRNYSELISALLLTLAVLLHYRDKKIFASLVLSYSVMIRQEFYLFILFYFVYLIYRKEFVPAFLLAVFPIFQNSWGWLATGDPLYLLNTVIGTSAKYQAAYPRQGFNHYFLMSLTIFGALSLTFFITYLAQIFLYKKKPHYFIIVPLLLYFLTQSIFSLQAIQIGPSNAGNHRYLVIISPLIAVLAAIGAERLSDLKNRQKLLYVLIPFGLTIVIFMSKKHNNIVFVNEFDILPIITVLTVIIGIFLLVERKTWLIFLALCSLIFTLLIVRPYVKSTEDEIVKEVLDWSRSEQIDKHPLLINHTLFYYYSGKTEHDFPNGAAKITKTSVEDAAIGTIILWDSHYSYRPRLNSKHLNYTYFTQNTDQFRQVRPPFLSPDRRFVMFVFKKISDKQQNPTQSAK